MGVECVAAMRDDPLEDTDGRAAVADADDIAAEESAPEKKAFAQIQDEHLKLKL
jgi:hypothetical protein